MDLVLKLSVILGCMCGSCSVLILSAFVLCAL